jgi:hypothetical protein
MKVVYRVGADLIFLFHFGLVLVAVFGFLFPRLWYVYMSALAVTFVSDLIFGYCIVSKWEFDLRKKIDPTINYNFTWTTYYTYKITNRSISDTFYRRIAIFALAALILLNVYFKFFFIAQA